MNTERLLPLAAVAATLLLAAALVYYNAAVIHWTPAVLTDVLRCAGLLVVLAAALRYLTPAQAPALLVLAVLLYLAGGVGPMQCAAVLLLLVSSWLLGRMLLLFMFPAAPPAAIAAFLCGLAMYLAVFGLMIHFPVNFRTVYLALLAVPLALVCVTGRLPSHIRTFNRTLAACNDEAARIPYGYFAAAIVSLTLIARAAFYPTLTYDDVGLHLGMWTQLTFQHYYAFDYIKQIWEVTPFAVDLLHASVSLVAGADARGALNLLFMAVMLHQLWVVLGRFGLTGHDRLLVFMLFVSTPLTGYMLITLQTELFLALLVIAAVRLVWTLRGTWCSPESTALLAIAAMCCAAKLTGAWLGITLLAAACLQLWFTRKEAERSPPRSIFSLAAFTVLLATVAFNAYLTAWVKTGNPVFPLYNAIFQSPYYDASNFIGNWNRGFSLANFWELFFITSNYFESLNFTAGFQYLLLFPLGLAVLWRRPLRHHAAILLIPLLGYGPAVFAATQYWRYQFPMFPLATILIGALLLPQYSARGLAAVRGALLACMLLNVAFYPGISWVFNLDAGVAYTQSGKQRLTEQYAPARVLTDWVNANAPGSRVLYPEEAAHGATLYGTPTYVMWYSPTYFARASTIQDEAGVAEFLQNEGVDFVITYMQDMSRPGTAKWALREYLSHTAVPILKAADHALYRVADHEIAYREVFTLGGRVSIDREPRVLTTVATGGTTYARYRAEFACDADAGYFVAQVNWNIGTAYYRLVPCSTGVTRFAEAVPVPPGASSGAIYATVRDADTAVVTQLSLETN